MGSSRVLTEKRGHVLVVTLNRPEARNAFDAESALALEAAADRIDAEDDIFLAVVTGAGGSFSAGADLRAVARGERASTDRRGGFGWFARPPQKPVIAAVEGHAVGGGFELALACDLIVAGRSAKFGLPEVRHNVVAIGGGLFRLPRRIPYHLAMEMALSGAFRSADELNALGLVNRVVEEGAALDAAIGWAEALQVNGPTALAATKEIILHSADWSEEEAWRAQMTHAARALDSEDRHEGLAAFAQKRKPVWKGR